MTTWFERIHAGPWDKQIADDLESGRLDKLLAEVDSEIEEGLQMPLPPCLSDTII